MSKLLIIAPLYKGPELIPALVESLIAIKDELAGLDARIILINDSPGYAPLGEALEIWAPRLAVAVRSEILVNAENLGFIGSCNRGFEIALREGADVLLLNSDCLITPGAIQELHEVSKLDPMTAVVSPRSNNATICNSPYPERFRSLDFSAAFAAHQAIQSWLPRATYVPTAVGFCLYIRYLMIKEFGVFDDIYGGGYNEENDFILRCNRRGYRAVMANHCFAYHIGNVSFSRSDVTPSDRELKNRAILLERYPEYERAVNRYFSSTEFKAQALTAGLIPGESGKLRLLFDCNNIGPFHNGTFELAIKMIQAIIADRPNDFEYHIACNEDALAFHGFDKIKHLAFADGKERQLAPFAVVIRLAQPFSLQHLVDITELAPITCFLILDTIALDCQNLDDDELGRVWRNMLETTSIVGFISNYSKDQFQRRFKIGRDNIEFVALCSTESGDYAPETSQIDGNTSSILLVGNHYPHKHVNETLDCLRPFSNRPPVVVLGVEVPDEPGITSYRAGTLEQSLVDQLYQEAAVVLFPSHYEGFGFPAVHALARRKPLIARRLPVFEEIAARSPFGHNIHLFDTTEEMVQCAVALPFWSGGDTGASPQTWRLAAAELLAAIYKAQEEFSFDALLRRIQHAELCRLPPPAIPINATFEPRPLPLAPQNDGVSRASEFAGAQTRRILHLLSRFATLRRLGHAVWRTRRHGRRIKVSLGDDISRYQAESLGAIEASASGAATKSLDLIYALLDLAFLLTPGGNLTLVVAGHPDDGDAMSALKKEGLRVWAISAGFEVRALEQTKNGLCMVAAKADNWTSALQHDESDALFVENAFKDALGRDASGFGAEHCRNELIEGVSRYKVLRHLYASEERALLIMKIYGLRREPEG